MDVKEIDILGESINNHWYYVSKARAMMNFLKNYNLEQYKILDIGAGSGFFSRYLLENTTAIEAYCVDIGYENESDEIVFNKNLYNKKSIDSVNVDLVLLMDVLEHVDNDVSLLKYYIDRVPSGTRFLITVPAFNFLWSSHDVFLEHKRRYTLKDIEQVLLDSGLYINQSSYYFGFVFPIAASLRIISNLLGKTKTESKSQLRKHSSLTNVILKILCLIEIPLMNKNKVAGLSAFCIATKA
jgi:SAM-dependent methyltransferase